MRGRITSWTDNEIHVLVPQGLPPGRTALTVATKAGVAVEPFVFTVQ